MSDFPKLKDWIPLIKVPDIVEKETGYRPTRQTVYNWARRGWLHVGVYKPLRTTRRWVLKCLETYKQMIGTNRGGRRSG